jgi:hypothetical protein
MPPTAYPHFVTPACADCGKESALPGYALCVQCLDAAVAKLVSEHCQRCGELTTALNAEGLCRTCYHLAQRA